MLTKTTNFKGFVIRATDGELGTIDEFYFDDKTWAIRYLTIETGGWLDERRVLISPISIIQTDWQAKRLDVNLTKEQVRHSPDIDTHKPVSRQHEAEYSGYYGYPYYWDGPNLWGPAFIPAGLTVPLLKKQAQNGLASAKPLLLSSIALRRAEAAFALTISAEVAAERMSRESVDSHLRSSEAVAGYAIEATDGEIGHINSFIVDDEAWAIRYIEVATRNWWPGKKVLIAPSWVKQVSWEESKVSVSLTRAAIESGPEYEESMLIDREYENRLYFHYGSAPYWVAPTEPNA